jgi:hypothetical protein
MIVLILIILQLIFESAMDAFNYKAKYPDLFKISEKSAKTWSKQAKGVMVCTFFALIYFCSFDMIQNWWTFEKFVILWNYGQFILAYITVRFALFNPLFNLQINQRIDYLGTTSITDGLLSLPILNILNLIPCRVFILVAGIWDILHITQTINF